MFRKFAVAWCACALATASLLLASTAVAAPDGDYGELLARAKRGDASVDFGALRLAYAESAQYHPYDDAVTRFKRAMLQAVREPHDCGAALGVAGKVLDRVFVDIDAHRAEDFCYRLEGDTASADFHRAIARGLLRSILRSGDGKSPATAYVVIAVDEEYSLIDALGDIAGDQALVKENDHQYDRISVKNAETGETGALYFNVDRPLAALAKELGGKEK